jgi:hypothetical protein
MTVPKQNGREEAGAWRRLHFSKMILCAEQTTETNQKCRPKKSHLVFCGQWFEDGVNLNPPLPTVSSAPAPMV